MIFRSLSLAIVLTNAPNVRAVADEVAALAEAGEFDDAFALIDASDKAAPDHRYIYMRASLHEQLGHCGVAVDLYRAFLDQAGDAADRSGAEAGMRRCGVEPPAPPPPRVEQDPAADPGTRSEPPPPPPPPRHKPNATGITITALGGAALVAGVGLWARAAVDANGARDASLRSEFGNRASRAERLELAGITVTSIGALILISGIVHLVVTHRRRSRS